MTWTAWVDLLRHRESALYEVIRAAFTAHSPGMAAYVGMMAQRLQEMERLLKPSGSIYLHCDPTASHYLKVLMDAIFGHQNFNNEIVWWYKRYTAKSSRFQREHDILLFYGKNQATFNVIREPYGERSGKKDSHYKQDSSGKWHRWQKRAGKEPYKIYLSEGRRAGDVWAISHINASAKERLGYPTQKPLDLLHRIIQASSNLGDVIFDPFCGCATTCIAAEILGRQWIGIDIASKAVELVESRLQTSIDKLALYHPGDVIHRTDQPHRTDMGRLPHYRVHLDTLYGQQGGNCGGCGEHFLKRNVTIDHIVPRKHGGTDHPENLWLLCAACNSSKGTKSQVEFMQDRMSKSGKVTPWLLKARVGERLIETRI